MIGRFVVALPFLIAISATASPASTDRAITGQLCRGAVCFPRQVETAGRTLDLHGAALFTYWGFEVYSAALYTTQPGVQRGTRILSGDSPVRLELHYHRNVNRRDIIRASETMLRENAFVNYAAIEDSWRTFQRLLRDVGEGDRYTILLIPGQGIELQLNGVEIGRVDHPEFAAAYLRIWLCDTYPINETMRDKLLARRAGDYR